MMCIPCSLHSSHTPFDQIRSPFFKCMFYLMSWWAGKGHNISTDLFWLAPIVVLATFHLFCTVRILYFPSRCPTPVVPKPVAVPTVPKPAVDMVVPNQVLSLSHAPAAPTSSLTSLEQERCDQKQPVPPMPASCANGGHSNVEGAGEIRAQNTDNYMSTDLLKVRVYLCEYAGLSGQWCNCALLFS